MKQIFPHIIAIALLTLLVIVFSRPLISHINEAIPTCSHSNNPNHVDTAVEGDHIHYMSVYNNWFNFYIKDRPNMTFSVFNHPPNTILDKIHYALSPYNIPLIIFRLINDNYKTGYNCTILFWLICGGYFMFLFSYRITHNYWVSYIAGILFAITPIRIDRAASGHHIGMMSGIIPLIGLLIVSLYKRFTFFAFILLTLCLWYLPEPHLQYYLILTMFAVAGVDVLTSLVISTNLLSTIKKWACISLAFLPLMVKLLADRFVLPIIYPNLMDGRTWEVIMMSAADWGCLITKGSIGEKNIYTGAPLFITAVITLILFCGIIVLPKFRNYLYSKDVYNKNYNRLLPLFFTIVILNTFIAIGPVEFTSVYTFFYNHLPGFNLSRVPARASVFALFGYLGIACILLNGVYRFVAAITRHKLPAIILVIILMAGSVKMYDLNRFWALDKTEFKDDIFSKLTISPYDTTILFLPLLPVNSHWITRYEAYSLKHRFKIVSSSIQHPADKYYSFLMWADPLTVYGKFPPKLAYWMISNKVDYVILDKSNYMHIKRDWRKTEKAFTLNPLLNKAAETSDHVAYSLDPVVYSWYSNNVQQSDIHCIEPGVDTMTLNGSLVQDTAAIDNSAFLLPNKHKPLCGTYLLDFETNTHYTISSLIKYTAPNTPQMNGSVRFTLSDPKQDLIFDAADITVTNGNAYYWYSVSFFVTNFCNICEFRIIPLSEGSLWIDECISYKINKNNYQLDLPTRSK